MNLLGHHRRPPGAVEPYDTCHGANVPGRRPVGGPAVTGPGSLAARALAPASVQLVTEPLQLHRGATGAAPSVVASLLTTARVVDPSEFSDLVAAHGAMLGIADLTVWLADVQQRWLVRFPRPGYPPGEAMAVDGTVAGMAYRQDTPHQVDGNGGVTVWVPLRDGDNRLGMMGGRVEAWKPSLAQGLDLLGGAVGMLIGAHRSQTDIVIRTRRRSTASLPTDIQWDLLPPLSSGTTQATVCGALEPAYDIGGDSFDYAINDHVAHLGVFDAMGHGMEAALVACVAVGAYRHARRAGHGLEETYQTIDTAVGSHFAERFVTGVLAELDLDTGCLRYILAGHHPALVLRAGQVVRHLDAACRLPFGLDFALGSASAATAGDGPGNESLEPGDRVLCYTDGVIEARDPSGAFFGLDRLEEFLVRENASGTSASETLRRLIHAVLEHQEDHLQDDATLLMVEWHP